MALEPIQVLTSIHQGLIMFPEIENLRSACGGKARTPAPTATTPAKCSSSSPGRLFAVIPAPRDKAIFRLLLRCGLRVGEIRQLSRVDLDLQPSPGQSDMS
jgi:integrase